MKRIVLVRDQPVEIHVSRKYKTVWVAVGEHLGHRIEAKGRSESQAVIAWRDAAMHKTQRVE